MVGFFSVSSGAFSSINTFKKTLTSTYFVDGGNDIILNTTPTKTFSFYIKNDSIYGVALHIKSCTPVTSDSTLTLELSGVSGSYALEYYKLTSIVQDSNDYNLLPLNWQLFSLTTPIAVPANDTIVMSLCTTNYGELSLYGQDIGYNLIDSRIAAISGTITSSGDANNLFNEQCLNLTGNNNGASFPWSTNYTLSTQNFTIEGWFKITSFNSTWNPLIVLGDGWGYNLSTEWGIVYHSTEKTFYFYRYNTDADAVIFKLPYEIFTNTWNHIVLTRNNTTLSLWINGFNAFSLSISSNTNFNQLSEELLKRRLNLQIGKFTKDNITYSTKMYVSNVRICRNVVKYQVVGNITLPTEVLSVKTESILYREPYEVGYANTESNNITTFNSITITNAAAPPVSSWKIVDSPFAGDPNDRISFLNSQKYVTIPSISSMAGDFTIEFWFLYLRTDNKEEYILDGRSSNISEPFVIGINKVSKKIRIYESNTVFGDVGDILPSTWYHLSINRRNNIGQIMLNGNVIWTFNSNLVWGGRDLIIGKAQGSNVIDSKNFLGYISNLRITRNRALYFRGFNLPSSPFVYENNTSFLLKIGKKLDQAIISTQNYYVNNYIEEEEENDCSIFNPQTTNSPYGQHILDWYRFDDNSSVTLSADDRYNLFNRYWSIDLWVYPVRGGIDQTILSFSDSTNYSIKLNTVNQIIFNGVTTEFKLPTHTWTHIALVRSASDVATTKYIVNGAVMQNISYDIIAPYKSNANIIIGSKFYGYLSNLHIRRSKKSSVYSTIKNATAPNTILSAINISQINTKNTGYYPSIGFPVIPFKVALEHSVPSLYQSIAFDGTNTIFVEANTSTADRVFAYGNEQFTYEFWVKPTSTGRMALVSNGHWIPTDRCAHTNGIYITNGEVEFCPNYLINNPDRLGVKVIRGGNHQTKSFSSKGCYTGTLLNNVKGYVRTNGAQITINKWHHIVVQRNSSKEIEFYVNGIKYYDYPSKYTTFSTRRSIIAWSDAGLPQHRQNDGSTVSWDVDYATWFNIPHTTIAWNIEEIGEDGVIRNRPGISSRIYYERLLRFSRAHYEEFLGGSNALLIGASHYDETGRHGMDAFKGSISQIRFVMGRTVYQDNDIRDYIYNDYGYTEPRLLERIPNTTFLLDTQATDPSFTYNNTLTEPAVEEPANSTAETVLLFKSPYNVFSSNNELTNFCIYKSTVDYENFHNRYGTVHRKPDGSIEYFITNKNFDLHDSDFTVSVDIFVAGFHYDPRTEGISTYGYHGIDDNIVFKIIEREGSYVFGAVLHRQRRPKDITTPTRDNSYISLFFGTKEDQIFNASNLVGNMEFAGTHAWLTSPGSFGQRVIVPINDFSKVTFIGDYATKTVTGYVNSVPVCVFPHYPSAKTYKRVESIRVGAYGRYAGTQAAVGEQVIHGYLFSIRGETRNLTDTEYSKLSSNYYNRFVSNLFIGKDKLSIDLEESNITSVYYGANYIPQMDHSYNQRNGGTVFVLDYATNNYSLTAANILTTEIAPIRQNAQSYTLIEPISTFKSPQYVSTDLSTDPDQAALYFNGNAVISTNKFTRTNWPSDWFAPEGNFSNIPRGNLFTFETWLKPANNNEMVIFSSGTFKTSTDSYTLDAGKKCTNNVDKFKLYIQNGIVSILLDGKVRSSAAGVILYTPNTWFHISVSRMTYDQILVTVNGKAVIFTIIGRLDQIKVNEPDSWAATFNKFWGAITIGGTYQHDNYPVPYDSKDEVAPRFVWIRDRFVGSFVGHMSKLRLQYYQSIYKINNLTQSMYNSYLNDHPDRVGIYVDSAAALNLTNKKIHQYVTYPPNSVECTIPQPPQNTGNIIFNLCGWGQGIVIPHKSEFNLYNYSWVFEAWVNMFAISNDRNNPLLRKGNSYSIYIDKSNNTLNFNNGVTTQTSTASFRCIDWVHLSFACIGTDIKLYIDGVLKHTFTNAIIQDNNSPLYIGYDDASYFAGSLANIRLIRGGGEYIEPSSLSLFPIKENTSLLLRNPYKLFTYKTSIVRDIHIGSNILNENINSITVTLDSNINVSNILIHKDGCLNIVDKGNLTLYGTRGIDVTVGGRLNISNGI